MKQLRAESRGHTWGTRSGPDSSPRTAVNVLGLLEILPKIAPNSGELVGEVEWVEFEVVWGEDLLGFELGNDVNGGGGRRKKKSSNERGERKSWRAVAGR